MKIFFVLAIFWFFSWDSTPKKIIEKKHVVTQRSNEQLEVYDFKQLEPFLHKKDHKIHVVNFWATWCAPCVKELPYFEAINKTQKNVEVLLVSLDMPYQYQTKLIPFIKKHQFQSKIIALDDTNQDKWIPAVDSTWSGALPATLIYNKDQRQFYEKSFTLKQLKTEIQKFTQKSNN